MDTKEKTIRDALILKLQSIPLDEPLFLIRGQDVIGPKTVRDWAAHCVALNVPGTKVAEALACAKAMDDFQAQRGGGKVPD